MTKALSLVKTNRLSTSSSRVIYVCREDGHLCIPSIPLIWPLPQPILDVYFLPGLPCDSSGKLLQVQEGVAGFTEMTQHSLGISSVLKETSDMLFLSFVIKF